MIPEPNKCDARCTAPGQRVFAREGKEIVLCGHHAHYHEMKLLVDGFQEVK